MAGDQKSQPLSAVILAAGMGTRLRDITDDRPKGLLEIDGCPLVKSSLHCLIRNGIEEIIIVNGYKKEMYKQLLKDEFPNISYVTNKDYSVTGSMHSLFLAKDKIKNDFILLESDLLYEQRAISILREKLHNTILLSAATHSGDEVYVYGQCGVVRKISKEKLSFDCQGELVGISRINFDLFEKMCRYYWNEVRFPSDFHYEDCISGLSQAESINYFTVDGLAWTEIDTSDQYQRALDLVYPQIFKNNQQYQHPN